VLVMEYLKYKMSLARMQYKYYHTSSNFFFYFE